MNDTAAHSPSLISGDPYDEALRAQVHPSDWSNPRPRDRYHLVVIGGGTAGLVTAAIAAGLGASVALVERSLLGGDCLNVGCVPSKALLRAAHSWHEARRAAIDFGGPAAEGGGDFAAVMERMRRLRAELSPVDSAERFRSLGVDVFLGEARFTGADTIDAAGATLRFRRAVIATGARPLVPAIEGLTDGTYLTNETVFTLTELPARLAVLGAGPIGCELAQAFARFGSEVTLLDAGDRILANDDPDAAAVVQSSLERDGVRLHVGTSLDRVIPSAEGFLLHLTDTVSQKRSLEVDRILVAVGRTPVHESLALAAAGVRVGEQGIEVDDRARTSNRRVFAIGDVASRFKFTHSADAQARLVVPNALFFGLGGGRLSRMVVPWCTYTDPELAHTGRTARELNEAGTDYDTVTIPLADVDRARLDGATEGFFRAHVAKGSGRLLGATMVGPRAGDIISTATLAIRQGLELGALGAMIHPYPTMVESLRKASDARSRARLTPTARRAFATFFSLFR